MLHRRFITIKAKSQTQRTITIESEKRLWTLRIDAEFIDYFIRITTKPHGHWRSFCKKPPTLALQEAVSLALRIFMDELEKPIDSKELL